MGRFILCALGLMLIFEGLPYFVFPERLKTWLTRISEVDASLLRVLGFVFLLLGTLIVYLARPS